ncbi:hypothetical protein FG386_003280 [Cryptosporidium ryanae]|uniref:uncharacterized protein n=1 Tax=Cryptosporidium ryanae TaxID=515981 RepID=UPI00351A7FEA|nr:hypothetical protein FG386_003280 [Cryptosporidium ryanae]
MHSFGAKNKSITPLRQPFETQISENDIYRSIGRWKSRFLSVNDDDYLSPSFLDDSSSLSSSPLFHDDTPNTMTSSSTSPSKYTFNSSLVRENTNFHSNENTPLNNRIFRKCTSTGTPIFTSPRTILDDEGFTIPDLPGSTKRKSVNNNRANNNASPEFNGSNLSDSVHIIMPPRLGLPSQTPLNLKDQYKKSPLPIVSANLDYRTTYMGEKLAVRANEIRNRNVICNETPYFQENRRFASENRYSESPSGEHAAIDEDDYILHHGELLRSRYLKLQELRYFRNHNEKYVRSRSLSSYYQGNNYNYPRSPGNRSNSVAMNYANHAIIGNLNLSKIKRRRIGSYVTPSDELLQQHIQLIDKSLERCYRESEYSMLDSVNTSLKDKDRPRSLVNSKEAGINHLMGFDSTGRNIQSHSNTDIEKLSDINSPVNYKDRLIGVEKVSPKLISNKESINPETNILIDEVQTEESCLIEDFENIEHLDTNAIYEDNIDSLQERIFIDNKEECLSTDFKCSEQKKRDKSRESSSSLEEIIPRPISHHEPVQIQEFNDNSIPNSEEIFGADDSKKISTKPVKLIKNRRNKLNEKSKIRNFSRKKHIDYHIPIDQVKPHRNTIQKHISDDSLHENISRRYPKRLRTAPLKWYLGERLEYHRDEKSELGYTIAAIHKVSNPTMLPNERGSIYPLDENVLELSNKSNLETESSVVANSHVINSKKYERKAPKIRKRDKGKNISEKNKVESNPSIDNPNAVILKNNETNKEFTMMAVFDRSSLCWADVEYSPGKPYSVALSFISSQATCCEICLPPLTEKGLDESQDNYILGHVYMAPDSKSLQIMISDNNVYNIGIGDWFLIPDNTNYNFSNTSDHSEIFISLYVIKES